MISEKALDVHNLTFSYNGTIVLWDVNFTVPKGSFVGVIGPNGAGKSTLFKAIMGILQPNSGSIKISGKDIKNIKDNLSYIPQRQSVDWNFPILVKDVVMMGRYPHIGFLKRPQKIDHKVVKRSLKEVGMEHLVDRQISELSGGQQQRVFFARSLAQEASIYLLDEPFSGIDTMTKEIILNILKKLVKSGKTVIVIDHHLGMVEKNCDFLILLNTYVRATGPVKEVLTPALLQATYGEKSALLNQVKGLLYKKGMPTKEEY